MKSESYGYDSSIISIHRIDEDGLRISSGHATAAVVANGWLVDPAQFATAKKVDDFVIDKGKEGYKETHDRVFGLYSKEMPASFYEFTMAKAQNELEADFYYIRGQRTGSFEDTKRAYELDPHHLFAASDMGRKLRNEGKPEEAMKTIQGSIVGHEELYLANLMVGVSIYQIQTGGEAGGEVKDYKAIAKIYATRASEINPASKIAASLLRSIGE